jgi:hypothetical protein
MPNNHKLSNNLPQNKPDLDLSQFRSPYEGMVLCPVCKFEYTHPVRVEADQGGEVVEVSHDGPGFLRRESSARGTVIHIDFYCEQLHEFRVSFQFHKGETFFWTSGGQEIPIDADGCPSFPPALWRD